MAIDVDERGRWLARASEPCVLGLILLVAGALRVWLAFVEPLWFDEAFAWRLSRFPVAEIVRRAAADNHSPFYFLVLKGWTAAFGDGVLAMRSLTILTSLAAIVFLQRAITKAGGSALRRASLVAAMLVALLPTQIYWGVQVRMYGLALAATSLAAWLLACALAEPKRTMRWVALGVAAATMAYAHYFTLFTLVAFALVGARGGRRALVAPLVAFALFAPWAPSLLAQHRHVASSWWAPPLDGWGALVLAYGVVVPRWASWEPIAPALPLLFGVVLATATALVVLAKGDRGLGRAASVTAGLPFALGALAGLAGPRIMNGPYLVFAQLSLVVVAAVLLARLRGPKFALALALVLGVIGVAAARGPSLARRSAPDYRELAAALASLPRDPTEAVVVNGFDYTTLLYFARDPRGLHVYGAEDGRVAHFNGGAIITDNDPVLGPADLAAMPSGRLFVVDNDSGFGTRHVPAPAGAVLVRARRFGRSTLGEYVVPARRAVER